MNQPISAGVGSDISVAVAIAEPRLREMTYEVLRGVSVRILGDLSEARDIAELASEAGRAQPDILLLGFPGLPMNGADAVREVRTLPAAPRIIAIHDSADPEVILGAMRAGASEFVYPPFGAQFSEALARVVAECQREQTESRPGGLIYGLLSAKGGCGASTLACHTAVYLQARTKKQVLLADLDFSCGAAAVLMRATPRYSVFDAVENLHRLDLTLWKALATQTSANVDLIAAPEEPVDPGRNPRGLSRLLRFWRSRYDYTILDLGRGLTPATCSLLDSVDNLLLVTTEDTTALRLAKQTLRNAHKLSCGPNQLKLVLNRASRRPAIPFAELERIMDHPFYATIPDDPQALAQASSQGRFIDPDSGLGAPVSAMAARLAGLPQEVKKVRKFALG